MADGPEYQQWQVPPAATSQDMRLGWLDESVQQGQSWLRNQRGSADFRKAFEIMAGCDPGSTGPIPAAYRSRLSTNRLKRNIREIIGTMSRLRPSWGYHSDNSAYTNQAAMMNKVTRAWYLESFADRGVKEALQYAATTCRGWIRPIYRREMYGTGKGDIKLLTYGSPCILPNQLPASGDWQSAYCVHILEEMPVAMAHGMFPTFQDRLTPSSSRYWYMNDGVRKSATGNILTRMFQGFKRGTGATEPLAELLVPIRFSYIIDLSINKTGFPIPMGEPGSSWAYTVPSLGQDIPAGTDLKTGAQLHRKANETDARLYPTRRLIISSDRCVTYDGPSFDWHGMFPGISFTMDEYPWEPLGFSAVHDGYEIQCAINEIARGNMDKTRATMRMSLAFDTNATSMAEARRFDPFKPDDRVGFDGNASEAQPFQPVIPPEVLKIEESSLAMWEKLEQTLDAQQGINDVQALAKLRAVGSMDDIDKIMEANGPVVEDMSRSMEPPMRDLGVMIKYLICQFFTTSRIMQWVGADNTSREVFDYDPTSIIPSHLPGENPDIPSPTSPMARARNFADNLRFFILPNSLHEITQMTMKLGLIQLKKAGVMIDSQTIAEAWTVPNYGQIDGNTVIERFQRESEMQLEQAARMKAIADAIGLAPLPGAPPGAPGAGGAPPEGRPPSGNAPPALASKDGGARSTITESK